MTNPIGEVFRKFEALGDKERVLAVWPDAWESGSGFIWESKTQKRDFPMSEPLGNSWADAASRLPSNPAQGEGGEQWTCDHVIPMGTVRCQICRPAVAEPAKGVQRTYAQACEVCGVGVGESCIREKHRDRALNDEGWCSSCDKLHETKRPLCPKCGDYLIFASDDVVEPNPPQGTLSDEQLVRWAYVRNLEKLCHERSKDGIEITVPDYDYRMLAKDIWQAAQAATVGVQEGALDAAWAKHCLVAYGEVVPLGKTMFRAGWQAAQSANTAAFNEGVEAATQWLIEDGRWPHGRTVQGIRRLKRIAPKTKDGE